MQPEKPSLEFIPLHTCGLPLRQELEANYLRYPEEWRASTLAKMSKPFERVDLDGVPIPVSVEQLVGEAVKIVARSMQLSCYGDAMVMLGRGYVLAREHLSGDKASSGHLFTLVGSLDSLAEQCVLRWKASLELDVPAVVPLSDPALHSFYADVTDSPRLWSGYASTWTNITECVHYLRRVVREVQEKEIAVKDFKGALKALRVAHNSTMSFLFELAGVAQSLPGSDPFHAEKEVLRPLLEQIDDLVKFCLQEERIADASKEEEPAPVVEPKVVRDMRMSGFFADSRKRCVIHGFSTREECLLELRSGIMLAIAEVRVKKYKEALERLEVLHCRGRLFRKEESQLAGPEIREALREIEDLVQTIHAATARPVVAKEADEVPVALGSTDQKVFLLDKDLVSKVVYFHSNLKKKISSAMKEREESLKKEKETKEFREQLEAASAKNYNGALRQMLVTAKDAEVSWDTTSLELHCVVETDILVLSNEEAGGDLPSMPPAGLAFVNTRLSWSNKDGKVVLHYYFTLDLT